MIKVKLWLIVEPYISLYLGNLVISHLSLILSFGPNEEDSMFVRPDMCHVTIMPFFLNTSSLHARFF